MHHHVSPEFVQSVMLDAHRRAAQRRELATLRAVRQRHRVDGRVRVAARRAWNPRPAA
jgi:hypothetical protein